MACKAQYKVNHSDITTCDTMLYSYTAQNINDIIVWVILVYNSENKKTKKTVERAFTQ